MGGIVGRMVRERASTSPATTVPAMAVPPSPSSPLRMNRREVPLPTSLARFSKCLSCTVESSNQPTANVPKEKVNWHLRRDRWLG